MKDIFVAKLEMEDIARREREQKNQVAREYMDKGYEVQRDVELDFVPGFRADMLARKDGETLVVEVKTASSLSRESRKKTRMDEMLESVDLKDGWSTMLHLVPERERLRSPEGSEPFGWEDISPRFADARRALAAGFPDAALLLAWSAAESAVRLALVDEGIVIKRVTTSGYTIGSAVVHGAITLRDADLLDDVVKYRNAIIHGFRVEAFDAERMIEGLSAIAGRLPYPLDEGEE